MPVNFFLNLIFVVPFYNSLKLKKKSIFRLNTALICTCFSAQCFHVSKSQYQVPAYEPYIKFQKFKYTLH